MELRATVFAFLVGFAVGAIIVFTFGAFCYFGYSQQVMSAPEEIFNLLFLVPALALGFVAGRFAISKPLPSAFVAAVLMGLLIHFSIYALAGMVGENPPAYTLSEFVTSDIPPVLVSLIAAFFTFRARKLSTGSGSASA